MRGTVLFLGFLSCGMCIKPVFFGLGLGKKVLQVDRNGYYGGESASLNLTHLFEKFCPGSSVDLIS